MGVARGISDRIVAKKQKEVTKVSLKNSFETLMKLENNQEPCKAEIEKSGNGRKGKKRLLGRGKGPATPSL